MSDHGFSGFIPAQCLYLISAALCTYSVCGSTAVMKNVLHKDLTANYSTDIRPLHIQSDTVEVGMMLYLMFIHGLDEKEQQLTFSAWAYIEWHDEFLTWNESEYSGISSLMFRPDDVWKPDLAVANSMERMTEFTTGEYLIRVTSDGIVDWSPGDIFRTQCTVDITYYPFDTQSCNITFSTWMYTVDEVDVVPLANISLADYSPSGEWDIVALETDRVREHFDCCPDTDTVAVTFIVKMARRKTFYILTVIIPVLMFSFLNVVDFVLPPNSGEKMSLSVTVFLSFAFFMSILNESMPKTSLSLSVIGIYMIVVMGMGTVSVVLSAFVIMVYHREQSGLNQACEHGGHRRLGKSSTGMLPDIGDKYKYEINGKVRMISLPTEYDKQKLTIDKPGGQNGGDTGRTVSLARRCDRLFLWFSLTFSVISSVVVLVVITQQ